jgi:hypothetical protein
MNYLQQFIDLHRQDIEPIMFAIALALLSIRGLIYHGGSDVSRPDLESALHPEHLESFLARAVEITWKDAYLVQEWRKLQQLLPQVREAWEKGQQLFQDALERTKGDQKSIQYFSMIDFAVDCYAEVAALVAYPDHPALRDWREHFLKDQEGEEHMEGGV